MDVIRWEGGLNSGDGSTCELTSDLGLCGGDVECVSAIRSAMIRC